MMNEYTFSSFMKEEMQLFIEKCSYEMSSSTVPGYLRYIKMFDDFLVQRNAKDINIILLSESVTQLEGLKDSTKNKYIAVLRSFLNYVNALRGKNYHLPEYRSRTDLYEPYYYEASTKKAIYEIADNWRPAKHNKLPWISIELPMIVRIVDGCGTRVNEVLTLQMQDIELETGVIVLKNTKGNKQRRVPMSENLSSILNDYCYAMGVVGYPQAFLFPRRSKKDCLLVRDIDERFRSILERLHIRSSDKLARYERGPCFYNLRHTFMINSFKQLVENGVTLDDTICYLSVYVGHNGFTETQRYLKFCTDLFPKEIDKFFGMADQLAPKEDKWERWGL